MAGKPSFDLFKLEGYHDELRAAIRALAEKEIAPYAKDVDENSRFPEEALAALNASGFNAVHVPLAYGGQGADAVASCIVVEEVARSAHPRRRQRRSQNDCGSTDARISISLSDNMVHARCG